MKNIFFILVAFIILLVNAACDVAQKDLKISLAEWSLHKTIQSGELTTLDFPRIAREQYDIGAIEYVSTLFPSKASADDTVYLNQLKNECLKYQVISNLIMIDDEGDLADTNAINRNQAVEHHYKWVRAASFLGCSTIRVNLYGEGSPDGTQTASIDALTKLCDYAKNYKINVIVENHWENSSNPAWLMPIIKTVNRENCGTLPDFGNFDKVDRYEAVKQMLPYAKGVSAKSYDFDTEGRETKIDFKRMIEIIKKSGYDGYIAVEYQGERLSEDEGIKATLKLLKDSY